MNGFQIHPAIDGGFFVLSANVLMMESRAVLLAGTLDECLAYIRSQLSKSKEAAA
jgi:hypothetical protein